jgi:inner membrane protein
MEQAELVISLSNQKGIRRIQKSQWQAGTLFFQPGNRGNALYSYNYKKANNGIYAELHDFKNESATFDISIDVQGGRQMQVLPIAQNTRFAVSSDWPSPSFQGAFLPSNSNITDTDFSADWAISYLSRDVPLYWTEYGDAKTYDCLFGVDFFRQIDGYALNTRAVKYAIIFLIIPFLTLFLLEIFTRRRIHPVPYLLSGIGNIIFYLLLLSLSEQLPFGIAYLIAAAAVTVMMLLYVRSLIGGWKQAGYMGFVMAVSYILLYAVLNAQSYALLIGSVGAFVITALVMFLTRKLDWSSAQNTFGKQQETKV